MTTSPDDFEPDLQCDPWQWISETSIYDNPWIELRERRGIQPDGREGVYGIVHFKNRAIGIIPVFPDGRIVLVGQYRVPLQLYSWEIPEGGGPLCEEPELSARRELREETGLVAGRLELIQRLHLSNSVTDEVGYLYLATDLQPGPSSPEGTEKLRIRAVHFQEAMAELNRGEILDSLTVIALLRLSFMANQGLLSREICRALLQNPQ